MKILHSKFKLFCANLWTNWINFCADKPAIPYLFSLIPLILINRSASAWWLPLWGFELLSGVAAMWFTKKRLNGENAFFYRAQSVSFLLGVIFSGLAIAAANLQTQLILPEKLDRRNSKCEAIIRLTDDDLPGRQNSAILLPKLLRGELEAVKRRGETTFEPINESIMLRLPEGLSAQQRYNLTYGEKLHVSGVLEFPAPPLTVHRYQIKNNHAEFISNSAVERFDYAGYLANQNITGTFNAEHLSATQAAANSIQGEIYQIRNHLLHLVTAGMVNDRDKNLTAGLLFGFRQGSGDNAAKAQYVDSGTIHIFSVSGLHVGILALILFAVLRILPWRWRYGLVIILLLLYVAATGANAPAMRAWVMISCFCISRMLKLNLTPVNAVLWAGVIILYYTPGQLLDIGFQYSFVITLFLLAAGGRLRDFRQLFTRRRRLLPRVVKDQAYSKIFRYEYKTLSMLTITLSAWCGALLVGLLNNGIFCSLSALINLMIAPLVFAAFVLLLAKLGFFWLPGISQIVNWSVNKLFSLIDYLINAGLDYSQIFDLPDLPLPIILLLSAGLILLAAYGRAPALLSGMVLLIAGIIFAPTPYEKFVAIVRCTSGETAVLVGDRRSGGGLAVNCTSYDALRYLQSRQLRRGVPDWQLAFIGKVSSRNYRNLTELLAEYPSLQLLINERFVINLDKMSIPLRNALDLSTFDNKLYHAGEFEILAGKTRNEIFSRWCRIIWANAPASTRNAGDENFNFLRVEIKKFVNTIDISERVSPSEITVFELN